MGAPGSEGANTWVCSDGIGYLGVAVVLGAMWFITVLAGALVAFLVRHDRTARVLLVLLAAISTVWILGWTLYGSVSLVQDEYAPMPGLGYWWHAVGPSAIISILSLAAGVVSLFLPGRASWRVGLAAAIGMAVATICQPGLALNLVPASGVLAAAALRGASGSASNPTRSRTGAG
jgi:hypothetical protein